MRRSYLETVDDCWLSGDLNMLAKPTVFDSQQKDDIQAYGEQLYPH